MCFCRTEMTRLMINPIAGQVFPLQVNMAWAKTVQISLALKRRHTDVHTHTRTHTRTHTHTHTHAHTRTHTHTHTPPPPHTHTDLTNSPWSVYMPKSKCVFITARAHAFPEAVFGPKQVCGRHLTHQKTALKVNLSKYCTGSRMICQFKPAPS